jgi:hypothetical protein
MRRIVNGGPADVPLDELALVGDELGGGVGEGVVYLQAWTDTGADCNHELEQQKAILCGI